MARLKEKDSKLKKKRKICGTFKINMKSSLQSFICSISNSSILLVSKILFWYKTLFSLFFNFQFKKCEKQLVSSGKERKSLVGTDLSTKIVYFGVEGFCLMRVVLLGCYFILQFPERVYLALTRFQVSSYFFFLPFFRLFESINRLVQVLHFLKKCFQVEEWLRNGFLGIKHLTIIPRLLLITKIQA